MGNIFIASLNNDGSATKVAKIIAAQGINPIFYQMDLVYTRAQDFTAVLDRTGGIHITYRGRTFVPKSVKAVWYRHPNRLHHSIEGDPLRRLQIEHNIRALQDGIFANFPESAWLNEPFAMRKADGKIYQLTLARSVGFSIPLTTITSTWDSVQQIPAKKLVVKLPYASLETNGRYNKALYTTILPNIKKQLPTDATPFPGIWQPYIKKHKEWRITVVGQQLFAAAIYTSRHAKHDWREHQDDVNKVRFCAEEFPKAEQQKCFALLKKLSLRYGAFDFIETPEGEIIFLEVNPNGQYGWLEDELGYPISKAIADELIHIASTGRV